MLLYGTVIKVLKTSKTFYLAQTLPPQFSSFTVACADQNLAMGTRLVRELFKNGNYKVIHTDELPPLLSTVMFDPHPKASNQGSNLYELHAKDIGVIDLLCTPLKATSITRTEYVAFYEKCAL